MKKMRPLLLLCLIPWLSFAQDPPNINFTDIKGNKHQLFDALEQGYIIFLDFSFIECEPCNEAIPEINDIVDDYEGQNVLFWYVSDRDSDEMLIDHLDSTGLIVVACGIDGGGDTFIDAFTQQFSFFGFPTISIICPNHETTWDIWPYSDGAPEWRNIIDNCNPIEAIEDYEPIEISTVENFIKSPFHFELKPNIFQGEGLVDIYLPFSTSLIIDIYNLQGQYIRNVFDGQLASGEHQLPLNFSLPHNGTYLMRYQTIAHTGAQKIAYLK